jgi:4-amino-4-deoxy-L-arabinose transferase-like glycosyltransferase
MEVVVLTALAAFLRGGMLLLTIDVPGDGPVKAWMAYNWAKAPHLVLHGLWPPGLVYVTGPVTYFLPNWVALRLFNAIVGTATVPVFFTVVARVFGPSTGLIAAAFIAVFPLHVELSATSLTEASTIFEILLGMTFLIMAAHPGAQRPAVLTGLAIVSLVLASMTRYEVWFLLPLFPCYYWLRTKEVMVSAAIATLLFAFPAAWTLGNYLYEGHALFGISTAMHDRGLGDTYQGVPLTTAMAMLVTRFTTGWGWVLTVLLGLGVAMECRSLVAGRLSPERILYLALVLVLLGGTGAFAVVRGETLPIRNFLFCFVFAIPVAIVPVLAFARLRPMNRIGLWVVIILTLIYTLGSASLTGPMKSGLLTKVKPHAMMRFEEWVSKSAWRDQSMIFTVMGWQPTYLPYYFPDLAWRMLIISEWVPDNALRSMTKVLRPALLVTQRGDEAYVERFVKVTGIAVDRGRLVHRDSDVEVYELVISGSTP